MASAAGQRARDLAGPGLTWHGLVVVLVRDHGLLRLGRLRGLLEAVLVHAVEVLGGVGEEVRRPLHQYRYREFDEQLLEAGGHLVPTAAAAPRHARDN